MLPQMSLTVCFLLGMILRSHIAFGKRDLGLYCGACKAIINEIEYEISKVDPRKKIDVGSFRVDPNGKTKTVKVAYARSEVFISEQLEEVCSKMNTYAESKSGDGKRKFVRTSSRDGEAISLENVSISKNIAKQLRFAVSYARSEGHIGDLLENICGGISNDYVKNVEKDTGKISLKRMVTRDGKMASDVDFQALMERAQSASDRPPDTDSKDVRFICESVIEEHEDEFVKFLSANDQHVTHRICSEIGEYCVDEDQLQDVLEKEEL